MGIGQFQIYNLLKDFAISITRSSLLGWLYLPIGEYNHCFPCSGKMVTLSIKVSNND
jgi:hypothetical protein